MERKVRAKFTVSSITDNANVNSKTVRLTTLYDNTIAEDQRFYDATPTGDLTMVVNNPRALELLVLGRQFYVDFLPID